MILNLSQRIMTIASIGNMIEMQYGSSNHTVAALIVRYSHTPYMMTNRIRSMLRYCLKLMDYFFLKTNSLSLSKRYTFS